MEAGFRLSMTLTEQMTQLAKQAKAASRALAKLSTPEKNACLLAMATALELKADAIKEANALDLEFGAQHGLSGALLDRLKLDDKRIAGMARGLREVALLPDPVGRILDERTRPNGLRLQKISTPIGVVVIIYESRPNVTVDTAVLALKTGNAIVLRGGKEAAHSNQRLVEILAAQPSSTRATVSMPASGVSRTVRSEVYTRTIAYTRLSPDGRHSNQH